MKIFTVKVEFTQAYGNELKRDWTQQKTELEVRAKNIHEAMSKATKYAVRHNAGTFIDDQSGEKVKYWVDEVSVISAELCMVVDVP